MPSGGVAPGGSVANVLAGLRIQADAGSDTLANANSKTQATRESRFMNDLRAASSFSRAAYGLISGRAADAALAHRRPRMAAICLLVVTLVSFAAHVCARHMQEGG